MGAMAGTAGYDSEPPAATYQHWGWRFSACAKPANRYTIAK